MAPKTKKSILGKLFIPLVIVLGILTIPLIWYGYKLLSNNDPEASEKEALLLGQISEHEEREKKMTQVIQTMNKVIEDQSPPNYVNFPEQSELPQYDNDNLNVSLNGLGMVLIDSLNPQQEEAPLYDELHTIMNENNPRQRDLPQGSPSLPQ